MVAVTEIGHAPPRDVSVPFVGDEPVEGGRIVAVAVTPMELLRPGSDLARMIVDAGPVDLLLACENEPVATPSSVGVLPGDEGAATAVGLDESEAVDDGDYSDDDYGYDEDDDEDDEDADELRVAADRLGLVDLHLHRLALPAPLSGTAESDLVAALSELVGFDPEPGVQVLAPAPLPGDLQRSVVDRAVRHIVQVYGLPLQRYRCMELSVVDDARQA
jgi:hypothetical protein